MLTCSAAASDMANLVENRKKMQLFSRGTALDDFIPASSVLCLALRDDATAEMAAGGDSAAKISLGCCRSRTRRCE